MTISVEKQRRTVRKFKLFLTGLVVTAVIIGGFVVLLPPKRLPAKTPAGNQVEAATVGTVASAFTVDGTLETDEVDVSSKLAGRLSAMLVDDGDLVHAGQVVAVLEADELDAKLEQASAGMRASEVQASQGTIAVELEQRKAEDQVRQARSGVQAADAALGMARAKLAALEKGARPQEIAQAEQGVAAAQATYDTAQKTYQRVKGLADEGVIAQQKGDEAEMAYRNAAAQLTAAKAKLDLVKEGARQEEIDAARQQVRQAEAGVQAARESLQLAEDARLMVDIRRKDAQAAREKVAASAGAVREVNAYRKQTKIVSPIDGRVSQRISRAGEIVAPGYAILSLSRTDGYWVDVFVDESEFAGRHVGDTVQVNIPALGKDVPGRIARVLPAADFATKRATNEKGTVDVRSVQLRVKLQSSLPELATGLTARVRFPAKGGA